VQPALSIVSALCSMIWMADLGAAAEVRLEAFLDSIGRVLGRKERRASFATYAIGLLSEAERKSVEPLAGRLCEEPAEMDAAHQRLLHFVTDSTWSDVDVRSLASRYAIDAMTKRMPIAAWIVDDTGFLKQGSHSVGVQRQYTGSAGKIANCQIGVSLSVATAELHVPIDFELYLPEEWTSNKKLRKEARIPDEVGFKTKPELALEMIVRAKESGVPNGVLLADSAYGDNVEFRRAVHALGFDYALGVSALTRVEELDRSGRTRGRKRAVRDLAIDLPSKRLTWREGTKGRMTGRFAFARVVPGFIDPDIEMKHREDVWLVAEFRKNETKYYLSTLPKTTAHSELVRLIKERYRTEQIYLELKGELGLDHYEGRRFPGWHHHVTLALCCYAFLVAERARGFPPSAKSSHRRALRRSP
jgi:SRSO17 transposase